MANNVEITILLDFYGDMLTAKQRDFINLYYNDDLSLAEIAENEGITRQGVRDAIERAEGQLYEIESRLGFVKKWNGIKTTLGDIINCAEEISDYNLNHGLSREINDTTVKIKSLALSIIE